MDEESPYWGTNADNGAIELFDEDGYSLGTSTLGYVVDNGVESNGDGRALHSLVLENGTSEWTLNANGSVTISEIPIGTYYVRETSVAGTEFIMNEKYYKVVVGDNTSTSVEIVN